MYSNYQTSDVYYVPTGYATTDQMNQLQNQVQDVTQIMRDNVQLGLQRGTDLDALEIKAEDLNNYSQQFAYNANEVHKKYWWQNVKMWIILILVIVVILTLIITLSVLAAQHKI